jgi:hypothetical protein
MRVRHLNLSHPEHSQALQAPLAESAGGLGLCAGKDAKPILASKDDPDYKRILDSLTNGVLARKQPGVKELLAQRRAQTR